MRELIHDGVEWHVHEANAGHVPGSRSDRCLIFDSEGVVRRLWDYPDAWRELSDEDLWRLVDDAGVLPQLSRIEAMPSLRGSHPALAAATEAAIRARSLLAELAIVRQTNQSLRDEREVLLDGCRQSRDEMRIAVQSYAASLKGDGVPPERAVLLIKSAMKAGIDATLCDDFDAERLFADGVSWGIRAYFAA